MLRILIVATLLLLVSATSVQAGSSVDQDESATVQVQLGARAGGVGLPAAGAPRAHGGPCHGSDDQ